MRISRLKFLALVFLSIGLIKILSLVYVLEGWVEDVNVDVWETAAFKSKIDYDGWGKRGLDNSVIEEEEREELNPVLLGHVEEYSENNINDWIPSSSASNSIDKASKIEEEGVFVVTGGLGNVGMALIKELLSRGIRVRCFDILSKELVGDRLMRLTQGLNLPSLFEYVEGDIRNRSQVENLFKQVTISEKRQKDDSSTQQHLIEKTGTNKILKDPIQHIDNNQNEEERNVTLIVRGVFHLAGISRKTECIKAPNYCESINVDGTKNLLDSIIASSKAPSLTSHHECTPWLVYLSSHEVN